MTGVLTATPMPNAASKRAKAQAATAIGGAKKTENPERDVQEKKEPRQNRPAANAKKVASGDPGVTKQENT